MNNFIIRLLLLSLFVLLAVFFVSAKGNEKMEKYLKRTGQKYLDEIAKKEVSLKSKF